MAPERESQQTNRRPTSELILSAFAKEEKKEGTGEEDRTPESIRSNVRKIGNAPESLK